MGGYGYAQWDIYATMALGHGGRTRKCEDTWVEIHRKHMYIVLEVLHGVLYPEAHSNRLKKKKGMYAGE